MSKAEKIKAITKRMQSLPTLPQVVKQFTAMVENPDVTAHEVGRLISSDQVLAGKVLRLVNSPFYGFPGRISSVSHAIILLGFDVIKGVVLSASVFDIMEQSMLGLWEHSLASAVVAGSLCRELGLPDAEEVSTAALLHDIGKVLVKVSLPEDYEQVATLVGERQCSFREAELEVLGVDHGDIGAWLAKEWNHHALGMADVTVLNNCDEFAEPEAFAEMPGRGLVVVLGVDPESRAVGSHEAIELFLPPRNDADGGEPAQGAI